jgi:hypothetical protein
MTQNKCEACEFETFDWKFQWGKRFREIITHLLKFTDSSFFELYRLAIGFHTWEYGRTVFRLNYSLHISMIVVANFREMKEEIFWFFEEIFTKHICEEKRGQFKKTRIYF